MKKAFTLIELLIVIAIIAILATVVFVNLNSARNRAKDAQVKSEMSELSKALEVVKVDRDLKTSNWVNINTSASNDSNINRWLDVDGNKLVSVLPTHPISGQSYVIKIISSDDYAILSRLTKNSSTYWCLYNGVGQEITASSLSAAQDICDR